MLPERASSNVMLCRAVRLMPRAVRTQREEKFVAAVESELGKHRCGRWSGGE
jgi:hypothetical protein